MIIFQGRTNLGTMIAGGSYFQSSSYCISANKLSPNDFGLLIKLMIKYISTGNFWKPAEEPNKFVDRSGSRGNGAEMYKRNYEDPSDHNFKASTSKHQENFTHQQYHQKNQTYNAKPYYYGTFYNSTQKMNHDDKVVKDQYYESSRNQNLNEASHLNNWKIVKERKYAQRIQKDNPDVQTGQILSKQEYQSRQSNASIQQNDSKSLLSRQNLFQISKPLLRIDNDLSSQPLIKNVQYHQTQIKRTVSNDVPKWCMNTIKFYTPENYDQSKKQRSTKLNPQDIFGNPQLERKKDPDNNLWQEVPKQGQIYEKSRMGIFYENPDKARKNITSTEIKKSRVHLKWAEEPAKQTYEPNLPQKIGWTEEIKIKKLSQKRDPNFPRVEKIGNHDVYKKLENDKAIQLKIGHGTASTLNPVKY